MALSKPKSGGAFFKPADHVNDLILVIEGKRILRDQTHTFEGVTTKRDIAVADIAIFRDSAALASGEPSEILKDAQITNTILVADVESNGWLDGGAGLAVIRKAGRAYVYRDDFTAEAEEAATKWYEARNAAREEAKADMPSFLSD